MSILSLAHVCIKGPDLDAVARFYCTTLGFEKQFNFTRNGRIIGFYLKVSDANFIEVFELLNPQESDKNLRLSHFCLETDTIHDIRKRLVDARYNPGAIVMGADQTHQFWIKDPTGVDIEFHQYGPESSQHTKKDVVANW